MSLTTFIVVSTCFMHLINPLSIEPVSPAVNLTQIFTKQNYSKINDVWGGYMTYYIDPNDSTNTKYLWLGTNVKINESTMGSYVLSDVFTVLFTEYPLINGTLDIVNELSPNTTNEYETDELFGNIMCTSPITKDIMTCWVNITWVNITSPTYQFDCRLYFVKTNTFSDIIQVTDDKSGLNFGFDVYCFNDSYFIPYSRVVVNPYNITPSDVKLYGALIDLKGVIKYQRQELKNLGLMLTYFVPVYGVVAYQFNPHTIDSRATNIFSLNFQTTNYTTNITNVVGLYGYYTNINDTTFPIYIYNETQLKSRMVPNANIDPVPNAVLNWYSACCYISIYTEYNNDNDTQIVYGVITDVHGSKIDISQYSDYEDMLLIGDTSSDVMPQVIDLPMISSESVHYFGVLYGISGEYGDSNTTAIRVFYLQYDENDGKFDLFETGDFETVKLTNINVGEGDGNFMYMSVYNLPGSNYICFAWSQFRYIYSNSNYYNDILGQTFLVS